MTSVSSEPLKKANQMREHSFSDIFIKSLQALNDKQIKSENLDRLFAAGMIDDISAVTIASTKAQISLDYAVELTNKVLAAYNEIMRLQL